MQHPDINEYLQALKSSRKFASQIVCHKTYEAQPAVFASPEYPLDMRLQQALGRRGITKLFSHQVEALEAIRQGRHVIVATPTASGKSLIYNIPVIEDNLEDPHTHALYLFPLKALARDQCKGLTTLYKAMQRETDGDEAEFGEIYDGDTSPYLRKKLRKDPPPVLITNPDMLHLSILPYHESWSTFFRRLKYVVIDEVHTYRGLFGAHMAWVLRRLQRIAHYYQAEPQFILLSATIGNPEQLAGKLLGSSPAVITGDGAPRAEKHFLFLNPLDSGAHAASQLLEASVKRGLRAIVYTKSRKMTELITMWTRPRLGSMAAKISSYRAGFLPEERRTIERDLARGKLLGVISTSALELGIDIGNLDLCILVGYPGSIMATWQRSGRVGRGMRKSAVVLLGGEDALDQHFMHNPEDFFSRGAEHAALNPLNARIARQHLHCAAAELPLSVSEPLVSGSTRIRREIFALTTQAIIHQDRSGERWHASRKSPQRHVNLRGGGLQFVVIKQESGEIIGEIDDGRGFKEAHPGAVYLQHAKTLLVQKLDIEAREIVVSDGTPSYYTRPMVHKQTEILERHAVKTVYGCTVSWGKLRVTEKVTGFQKLHNFTRKIINTLPLDLPEHIMETEGLWLTIPEEGRRFIEARQMHFMGAIHAVEHAMIAMFPLLILCDRNDIGGISCPCHEQTGGAAVFIYDGYVGGAGLTEQAYEMFTDLLQRTRQTITQCGCETGCPSCVHSPKCGSGNRPIDKTACVELLQWLLAEKRPPEAGPKQHIVIEVGHQLSTRSGRGAGQGEPAGYPLGLDALPRHYCVFDLETKRSAKEVGGWGRAERMGVSVGVVYDSVLEGVVCYFEDEIERLIEHVAGVELVVGFNHTRFDYRVLAGYCDKDFSLVPTIDLLEEVQARLGYRLSLNRLAEETLGVKKSGDGLQALRWYKQGRLRELADYCQQDVIVTRDLFLFGLENGHLLFCNKAGASVRLPLAIDRKIYEQLSAKKFR